MTASPFVVAVGRLRRNVGHVLHEARRGPLDPDGVLAPRSAAETAVPEGAEAECDVVLESFIGGVMVRGTVRAPWRGVCRRCTAPVAGEVVAGVRERFVEAPAGPSCGPAGGDDEAYPIDGDLLDLYPMVRDTVLLELPAAPLCRPDCRGLCPWCGTDRNERACGCVAPRDARWANLDVLREHAHEGT